MTLASLVAFGAVFVGTCLAFSLLLTAILLVAGKVLRRSGPWVERRAAAAAVILPPLLAAGFVAALAADSALGLAAGTDHCLDHPLHHHLCLSHGSAWLSHYWALGIFLAAAGSFFLRLVRLVWAHARAQRSVAHLRAIGEPAARGACYLLPSEDRFAFTAGMFSPAVFVSRGAWDALTPEQREAILAHESAHIRQRDLLRRAALGLAAACGVPFLANRALRLWTAATERICDRHAVRTVGRPSTVASAMLALLRPSPPRLTPNAAFFCGASDVPERIEAMLRGEPGGERTSRRLVALAVAAGVSFAVACSAFAGPIHHVLESALG
jgi:Zn-dependent protease with chaperone function